MYVSMYSYVCFRGKYIVRAVLPIALRTGYFHSDEYITTRPSKFKVLCLLLSASIQSGTFSMLLYDAQLCSKGHKLEYY